MNATADSLNAHLDWKHELLYFFFVHPVVVAGAFISGLLLAAVAEAIAGWHADRYLAGPYYPFHLLAGFGIGLLLGWQLRSKSGMFVWLLAAAWLWDDLAISLQNGGLPEVLRFLSARDCGGCMEQLFVLCPFYTSVAYSIGTGVGLGLHKFHTKTTTTANGK